MSDRVGDCDTCDRTGVELRLFNGSIWGCDLCAVDLVNDPALRLVETESLRVRAEKAEARVAELEQQMADARADRRFA